MTKRLMTAPTAKASTAGGQSLGLMGLELMFYSWETMVRRGLMIASGTCPPAEYLRMIEEKTAAIFKASRSLAAPGPHNPADLLSPFHAAAKANAKRLARR